MSLIISRALRPTQSDGTFTAVLNVNFSGGVTLQLVQPEPSPPQAGVWITIQSGGFTAKGKSPMAYTLPDGMQIAVQVSYVDKNGNPATVDGDTEWETSNEDIVSVVVDADDSTRAEISGLGTGQAQITSTADADLGDGVRHILATLDINVVAGEAVSATITPSGDPQPIPDDVGAQR